MFISSFIVRNYTRYLNGTSQPLNNILASDPLKPDCGLSGDVHTSHHYPPEFMAMGTNAFSPQRVESLRQNPRRHGAKQKMAHQSAPLERDSCYTSS